jgi:hypothetical protein
MYKRYYKFTILSILAGLVFSCELNNANEGDYDGTNPRSGWIEFSETSSSVLSTDGSVNIPIDLNVDINDSDTEISYTVEVISGNAPETNVGTFTAVVPSGALNTEIDYDIDSSIETNYTLQFTIIDTSNPDVIVGLEGDNPIIYTLEVCSNEFPLSWTGNAFFDGGSDPVNTFDMTLTPTGNPGEYDIDTAWGPDYVALLAQNPALEGQFLYAGVLTINPDNSISIVGNDPSLFPGTVTAAESTSGNEFDPCASELRYTLSQALFTGDFVVNVVLSAN